MKISEKAKELIKIGRNYHVHYGDDLANHLSMALIALAKMGASDNKLEIFFDDYVPKLDKLFVPGISKPNDFRESLGNSIKFHEHLAYFREEVKKDGTEKTIKDSLPHLLPGLSASAFHAMIRLAYAIQINDEDEIIYSLAFWASEYKSLGEIGELTNNTCEDLLSDASPIGRGFKFAEGNIIDRMVEISQQESFNKISIQPKKISLEEISKLAIVLYLGTMNFTMLHGVTSCHAMRLILEFVENKEEAIRYLWQAFVVAYLSTGSLRIGTYKKSEIIENIWNKKIEKIQFSKDDHQIKITYTCIEELKHYGWDEYKIALTRLVK